MESMEKNSFLTVKNNFFYEIPKIKGSRFIGRVYPVSSKEDAENKLEDIRKEFYNVTHNCFAYRVGSSTGDGSIFRFSDDGEPAGTAGKPILNSINSASLTNILVVVTRIYGGTKLGTGGLIRAYGQSAREVLDNCNIIEVEIFSLLSFFYEYDFTNLVMNLVNKFDSSIVSENYGDFAEMEIKINSAFKECFIQDIFERSNGKIKVNRE